MDKVKYIPLGLFTLAAIKALFLGASYSDVLMLLVLGSVAVYYEFKNYERSFIVLTNKVVALEKALDETKTHVGGLKIGQQMRNVGR